MRDEVRVWCRELGSGRNEGQLLPLELGESCERMRYDRVVQRDVVDQVQFACEDHDLIGRRGLGQLRSRGWPTARRSLEQATVLRRRALEEIALSRVGRR